MNRKEFEKLMRDRFFYSTHDFYKYLSFDKTERKYKSSEMQLLWEVVKCVNQHWENKNDKETI